MLVLHYSTPTSATRQNLDFGIFALSPSDSWCGSLASLSAGMQTTCMHVHPEFASSLLPAPVWDFAVVDCGAVCAIIFYLCGAVCAII